jgi:predicted nucleotidyltransferase
MVLDGRSLLTQNSSQLVSLCQKHGVQNLYAFGSVVKDTFSTKSDIDLLVRCNHENYGQDYLDLKDELEELFNKQVDLVTVGQMRNPYFIQEIKATAVEIYG